MNKDKTLSDKIQIAFVFTDLAVVIGNEIDFFGRNSTLTGHANVGDAISLAGVTYDDTTKTMYLSDVDNKDVAIFSIDLTEKENFTMTSLLKSEYTWDEIKMSEGFTQTVANLCHEII